MADRPRVGKVLHISCVVLLLALATVFLIANIRADAPIKFSNSAGLSFDPPSKCHTARNKVLFGKWSIDEWTPYLHSPMHTMTQTIVFRFCGIGYAQMRYVSIALTILSLLLIYLITSGSSGAGWGLLALLLAALSFPVVVYGRSGLLEPYVIFFMFLSVWLFMKSHKSASRQTTERRRNASIWLYAAALSAAMTFLSKPISLYFIAAFIIMAAAHPPFKSLRLRITAPLVTIVPLLAYYLGFKVLHPEYFQREAKFWISRASKNTPADLWIHEPLIQSFRDWQLPLMLIATASIYLIHKIFSRKKINPANSAIVLLAFTFLIGSQFDALISYRPMRYYFPLLFIAYILAVSAIAATYRWIINPQSKPLDGLLKPIFWWITTAFILKFGVFDMLARKKWLPVPVDHWTRMSIAAIAALVFLIGVVLSRGFFIKSLQRVPTLAKKITFAVIIIAVFLPAVDKNQKGIIDYVKNPRYDLYAFSKYLGQSFRDVTIGGPTPHFAIMENNFKAVKITNYHLNWSAIKKGLITHLVLTTDYRHDRQFKRLFPKEMRRTTLIDRLYLNGVKHNFYAFDLQPLKIAVEKTHDGKNIRIYADNPDPHTPQTVSFLLLNRGEDGLGWVDVRKITVPPSNSANLKINVPEEVAGSVEIYVISPTEWLHASFCVFLKGKVVNDIKTWGLLAVRFRNHKKEKDSIRGPLAFDIEHEGKEMIVAVSLRGEVEEGATLLLECMADENTIWRQDIPLKNISSETYSEISTIVSVEGTSSIAVHLSLHGRGTVFLGDILVTDSSRDLIEKKSIQYDNVIID